MTARPRIPSPAAILKNHLLFRWIAPVRRRPIRPRSLCLFVTSRCNMRCRTCGIWKNNREAVATDLPLDGFDRILRDAWFSKIGFVNLNGGEPLLRIDLADIAGLALKRFPRLHTLTLNTNAFLPRRAVEAADRIAGLCADRKVKWSVSVSLHRPDAGYDEIAGVRGAFARVMETLEALRNLREKQPFYLAVNCVVSNLNLDALEDMVAWGRREEIPVNFTLGEMRERFNNLDAADVLRIRGDDRIRLARFLRTLSGRTAEYFQHALRYGEVADMLEYGRHRSLACQYAIGGLILGSDGTLFYCKNCPPIGSARERPAREIYEDPGNLAFRAKTLFRDICPDCPPNTMIRMEAEKDLVRVLIHLLTKGRKDRSR